MKDEKQRKSTGESPSVLPPSSFLLPPSLVIIAAALPPQLDGIGDYSARVAAELADSWRVTVLTGVGAEHDAIPGVEVKAAFAPGDAGSVRGLVAPIAEMRPDWVLLQYNPFSYGKRGWNPYLAGVLREMRKASPNTRIAVMAHETFVPAESVPFVVMAAYQRAQYFAVGRQADVMFLSVEKWARQFQRWFPRIPVWHLPVGSNLSVEPIERNEARARLGISAGTFVVGLFGQAHPSRMFSWVGAAMAEIRRERPDSLLLYVGPHEKAVREILPEGVRLLAGGPFSAAEASRRFSAMDLALSPYLDGVSTRRGAFMAGIQHGVPTVGTSGIHTDSVMTKYDGEGWSLPPATDKAAFLQSVRRLLQDSSARDTMGRRAQELYYHRFDWKPICAQMLEAFQRKESSR